MDTDTPKTKLIWATPDGDRLAGYIARVSNPANQNNPDATGLIRYCLKNGHWSVFEMVNACIEVNTTRDIARQILRHQFKFQEFSQRYQDVSALGTLTTRECRMQDTKNRQNSLPADDGYISTWWETTQRVHTASTMALYQQALANGIAKEQARALLPEGMTPSRLYMQGTVRNFIHWIQVRTDPSTQKEHREVAESAKRDLYGAFPMIMEAAFGPQ